MSTIIIGSNTIISVDTTYSSDTLDLSNGNFIVVNNATLTIQSCTINGILSNTNPTLISVVLGTLNMDNNIVSIKANGLFPHPDTQSLEYVIRLEQAKVNLDSNSFSIEPSFTAGLLISDVGQITDGIMITNNTFLNFHGVLYLLNSNNTFIADNLFKLNSYGNMVLVGNNCTINNNKILFAGIDHIGNGIDIIDSSNVKITNNVIFTPTCRGIFVVNSNNVVIDSNSTTGGITYAIILVSDIELSEKDNYSRQILDKLGKKPIQQGTHDITISNNVMSQNRYGLAATDVEILNVNNNYFSQRFEDAASRQFWTNNATLLVNVTGLVWTNNVYKEAFTQVNGGDNSMTQFVPFPETGGVVI